MCVSFCFVIFILGALRPMAIELGSAPSHAPSSSLSWVLTPSCPFLFSHLILFVPLPLFCGPAYLPPRNCLCMTVAVTGSECLYVCVCMCLCVYACIRVCARAYALRKSDLRCLAPLGPSGAGCLFLGCWAVSENEVGSCPTPGLSPGQGLTKQQAGDVFVFNCGIWGVFARSPFPHPLFLTFPCNNSLVSPYLPPTPHFFHFLLIKISHHPKQIWDTSIHFFSFFLYSASGLTFLLEMFLLSHSTFA